MLLETIPLGRTVEIYVDREGYRYRLTSKVEYADEKKVCVTLIAARGRAFKFMPEDNVSIIYRDNETMWEWPNCRAGIAKMEGVLIHYFEISDKGKSFNRRNAYRVTLDTETMFGFYMNASTGMRVSEMPYPDTDDPDFLSYKTPVPEFVHGMVKDVSETGVNICLNVSMKTDDAVFFNIPSPLGELKSKAQIVRKSEINSKGSKYSYSYGCVFQQTDNRLIKYIYDIQRERLKKQRELQEREEELRMEISAQKGQLVGGNPESAE